MADKTMHHVVIGSDTYEIVDSTARADVEEATQAAYAALATDTATGSIATFPDGADSVPVKSLTVQIQPQQAGSGDPSPDNVRAISGWDTVHVYVDETVGTHDDTYTVNLPQTVYGGTLDVTSGVLTIDHGYMTVSGDSIVQRNTKTQYNFPCATNDANRGKWTMALGVPTCDRLVESQLSKGYSANYYTAILTTEDLDTAKTQLNGMQVVYPLNDNAKQTIQLTPTEVSTLLGDNNIYADAGEVNVVYRADTGLYIDKRLSNA